MVGAEAQRTALAAFICPNGALRVKGMISNASKGGD